MSDMTQMMYELKAREAAWPLLPLLIADVASGAIVYVSKPCADLFCYSVEEMLDQPVEICVPEALQAVHAVWRQDQPTPKTRLMGQGRLIHGRRKDGSVFPCHVGLTAAEVNGVKIGIAFIIDLTSLSLKPVEAITEEGQR